MWPVRVRVRVLHVRVCEREEEFVCVQHKLLESHRSHFGSSHFGSRVCNSRVCNSRVCNSFALNSCSSGFASGSGCNQQISDLVSCFAAAVGSDLLDEAQTPKAYLRLSCISSRSYGNLAT